MSAPTRATPPDPALSAVATVLTPSERAQVDAAGAGLYRTMHRESLVAVLNDLFGLGITDAFCGYKAQRVASMRKLGLDEPGYPEGWLRQNLYAFRPLRSSRESGTTGATPETSAD